MNIITPACEPDRDSSSNMANAGRTKIAWCRVNNVEYLAAIACTPAEIALLQQAGFKYGDHSAKPVAEISVATSAPTSRSPFLG